MNRMDKNDFFFLQDPMLNWIMKNQNKFNLIYLKLYTIKNKMQEKKIGSVGDQSETDLRYNKTN